MRKRFGIGLVMLALAGIGWLLLSPAAYLGFVGWVRHEAVYAGQPTGYWAAALKHDTLVGPQGDVGKVLREGAPDAVPVLCELLEDEDATVRVQAVLALALVKPAPEAVAQALSELLRTEPDPTAFGLTLGTLSGINRSGATPALVRALRNNPEPRNRATAALVLDRLMNGLDADLLDAAALLRGARPAERIHSPEAARALHEALTDDAAIVRVFAARGLWHLEGLALVVPVLVDVLRSPEPRARQVASGTLREIGRRSESPVPPELFELLKAPDMETRSQALGVVAAFDKDPAAVRCLIGALRDPEVEIRRRASLLLAERTKRHAEVVDALTLALRDSDEIVRVRAAGGLVQAGQHLLAAAAVLTRIVRDSPEVTDRRMAVESLGEIRPPPADVIAALHQALQAEPDPEIRVQAAGALWKLEGRAAPLLPVLIGFLRTHPETSALSAAQILGSMGAEARAAVPALLECLGRPDSDGAINYMDALGSIGPEAKAAVPALKQRLQHRSSEHRLAAARALWRIAGDASSVVPVLAALLRDPYEFIRQAATELLGQIGPPAASAAGGLRRLLDDPSPAVQQAAAQALKRVAPEGR